MKIDLNYEFAFKLQTIMSDFVLDFFLLILGKDAFHFKLFDKNKIYNIDIGY